MPYTKSIHSKKYDWDFTEDPLTYLHSDPSYYVHNTQTSFTTEAPKIINSINGTYTTSIQQTRISEFDYSSQDLQKYGFEVSDYLVSLGNRCSKTGYFQKCDCGQINFKPHYGKGALHKWTCPICARARAKSLGRTKFHTILALKPQYIGYLTLTLPHDHSMHNTKDNGFLREQTENYLREKSQQFLDHFFNGYGYYSVIHDWHSEDPLTSPHYHAHITIPLVKIENKKKVLANGYRSQDQLNEFREYWRQILGYPFEVNLNYQFGTLKTTGKYGIEKLRHWCSYIARAPIIDVNEWLLQHGNPDTISYKQKKWFNFLTSQIRPNYKRYRGYGLLSEGKIGQFLKDCNSHLEIVHEAIRKEKLEAKKLYCFDCGIELSPKRWRWFDGFIPRVNFATSKEKWNRYLNLTSSYMESGT